MDFEFGENLKKLCNDDIATVEETSQGCCKGRDKNEGDRRVLQQLRSVIRGSECSGQCALGMEGWRDGRES